MKNDKRLYRSVDNRIIAGVMGGLGEYFLVDPVLFRVAYIIISVFTAIFPGILAYIFMAIVMPEKPKTVHENTHSK